MLQTRKIFALLGSSKDVKKVLDALQFKGCTTYTRQGISKEKILEVFANNKNVICTGNVPEPYSQETVNIEVLQGKPTNYPENYYIDVDSPIIEQFQSIALMANCDIGDHKSNDSGLTGISTQEDCGYCKYLKGKNKYQNRTVYRSENFFVIPTLGEFEEGYLLIIPIRHIMSSAEYTPLELSEFKTVLEDVIYILNLTYQTKSLLVWENGTGNNGMGKAKDSVVHAHVHIAPSLLTADEIQKISGFHFAKITYEDFHKYSKHSYLLIKNKDETWQINSESGLYIPRQYIRQLLAMEQNVPGEQWNWRKYPFVEKMYKTVQDISSALHANWDILPERIKKNMKTFKL